MGNVLYFNEKTNINQCYIFWASCAPTHWAFHSSVPCFDPAVSLWGRSRSNAGAVLCALAWKQIIYQPDALLSPSRSKTDFTCQDWSREDDLLYHLFNSALRTASQNHKVFFLFRGPRWELKPWSCSNPPPPPELHRTRASTLPSLAALILMFQFVSYFLSVFYLSQMNSLSAAKGTNLVGLQLCNSAPL